ncbi:hypothetical protein [Nonomuraea sp. NEAU-A123]|uniref:hypothetical protein n=1 Tax=Nonomuraea sp. NEAU-A123 TaxID=2839649 RepID=UPI001BE49704|nr:hypothetical protein [Nonomuraea sp. NEAU-A123]MBT2230456.1 hypothetical protein [Nonomuraea sp. NEAU-A123]
MRIDALNEDRPELVAGLRLLYNVAATQRVNAAEGLTFASIRLNGDRGRCTVIPAGNTALECHVDYSISSRDALRDTLAAQGVPLRTAAADDGVLGMPKDDDSPLIQHAWIIKMIAYGVDPWTVYGRSWSGDLLEIRLSHGSTEAIFRIDGVTPLVTVDISHAEPARRLGLNYTIVDRISRLVGEEGEYTIQL